MALGEKSFFWDKPAGELTPEEAAYYEYAAQDLASVYECMYTTGICPAMAVSSPEDNPEEYIGSSLRCSAGEGLSVVVSPGAANIKGRLYLATLPVTVTVAAGVVTDVVLRMDLQSEKPTITLQAKQRASGVSLAQNLSHESLVYEIAVATVDVPVGSIQTDLSMITDQRLNTTAHPTDGKPVSGLMRSIPYVETLGIWEEWTALKEQIEGIIADAVSGVIPDLSVTTSKFAPDAKAPYAGVADEAKNGVRTLTHSKYGTTHNLAGLSGVSGTVSCVFKATAAFNAGDTIRVDNTGYTIQLSNGEDPEDNLFVSGATVAVIVDKGNYRVNFKAAGGVKLPAGSIVIVNRFTANGQFTVPATGTYRITAIGPGGDGGNSYYNSSNGYRNSGGGGGSGGVAVLTAALSKGEVYPVTVSTAQCSFGSLISATTGKAGDYTPGGAGGTAAGGDTNFSGNYGENGKAEMNAVSGGGGAGYTEEQIATVPALSFTGGAGGDETPSDGADVPGAGWSSAGLGGGGAGCDRSARSGGTGGNGAVIIEMVLE